MLSGAGLRDDAILTHALSQQCLAQDLVGLVGTTVNKVLAFEEDARLAAELVDFSNRGWTAQVITQEVCEFLLERLVLHGIDEGLFELVEGRDERFWDELSAEFAEVGRKECLPGFVRSRSFSHV